MKLSNITLAALAVAVMTSCDKVEVDATLSQQEQQMRTISITEGDDTQVSYSRVTTSDWVSYTWVKSDKVSAWHEDGSNYEFSVSQVDSESSVATIEGEVEVDKTGNARLLYPYADLSGATTKTIDLSAQVLDATGTAGYDTAIKNYYLANNHYLLSNAFDVSLDNPATTSQHLVGVAEVIVRIASGDTAVTNNNLYVEKITITGLESNEITISSQGEVSYSDNGNGVCVTVSESAVLGAGDRKFPIAIAPQTEATESCTVTVYFTSGAYAVVEKGVDTFNYQPQAGRRKGIIFSLTTDNLILPWSGAITTLLTDPPTNQLAWQVSGNATAANVSTYLMPAIEAANDAGIKPHVILTTAGSVAAAAFGASDTSNIATNELEFTLEVQAATDLYITSLAGCTKMTELTAPTVTTLGNLALSKTGLTTIELPEVTTVGNKVFQSSPDLTSISLPQMTTVTSSEVGSLVFDDCPNLTHLTLGTEGDGVNYLLANTFGDSSTNPNYGLENVHLTIKIAETLTDDINLYVEDETTLNVRSIRFVFASITEVE